MSEQAAVVTVSTANQFGRVKLLMEQAAKHIPDAARVVCCVDCSSDPVAAPEVGAHVTVNAADCGMPRFRQLAFALPPTGLCCALKPSAVLHALQATGATRAIYLDNDMALYRRPEEMLGALESHSMVLTPHITEPLPAVAMPDAGVIQQYGIWNAGMFGVQANAEAMGFLRWWSEMMTDPRRLSSPRGWDQQWLEFAPSMVEAVSILRDTTYNAAVWNLPSRRLARSESGWTVDECPLTTFHFSWFDEKNPHAWLRGGSSCNLPITKELVALGEEYAGSLRLLADPSAEVKEYDFSCYRDGEPVSAEQRELVARDLWDDLNGDEDLFDAEWSHPAIPGGGPLSRWKPRRRGAGISYRLKQSVRSLVRR